MLQGLGVLKEIVASQRSVSFQLVELNLELVQLLQFSERLLPLAVVVLWLWLNPRVFAPIHEPTAWASKGIFGEEVWARRRAEVPVAHRAALRLIAVPGVVGIALLGWGLVALEVWPTISGVALVVLAQLWRIDRLVWMYEDLSRRVPRGTTRAGDEQRGQALEIEVRARGGGGAVA